jgi:DNA-binding MarR family transcriptional regulator
MRTGDGEGGATLTAALDRVLELALLLDEDMDRELSARNLTKARTRVLWEISQRPAAHQKELADAVGVTPRTMTGLIDGLTSTGFAVRTPDPADRRAQRVELTPAGRAAAHWLVTSRTALAQDLFGDMPAERLDCFAEGLAEVITRLRAAMERARGGAT